MGRLFENIGMKSSAPGEPQKFELASQVEIQKLRIQVEQTNVMSDIRGVFRVFYNFTTLFVFIYLNVITVIYLLK